MLTLNATLATQMASQSRRPLVEIISLETEASIPFDGTRLDSLTVNEHSPTTLMHSSGRVCSAHCVGNRYAEVGYALRYRYSDALRQEFTVVDIAVGSYLHECNMCELVDGSIGILVRADGYGSMTAGIHYFILTVTGSLTATAYIFTPGDYATPLGSGAFPLRRADNTYLMAYVKQATGDPNSYLCTRTSNDFMTWSAETVVTLTGFDANKNKRNPFLMHLMDSGDPGTIWLMLDYAESVDSYGSELTNAYRAVSVDGGATWATPIKMTNYVYYKQVAKHPSAIQKTANSMHFFYDEHMYCLHMDKDTLNFVSSTWANAGPISFDSANRKLLVCNARFGGGYPTSMCVVDVDNWEVDKLYTAGTSPAIPNYYKVYAWNKMYGDENYLAILGVDASNQCMITILNSEADTVQIIYPDPANASYNVTGFTAEGWGSYAAGSAVASVYVDASAGRVYALYSVPGVTANTTRHQFGYFTLVPGASYAWTQIGSALFAGTIFTGDYSLSAGQIKVFPESGYVILNFSGYSNGACFVYALSGGGLITRFHSDTQANFPVRGMSDCTYVNGVIYGSEKEDAGGFALDLNFVRIDVGSELVQVAGFKTLWGTIFRAAHHSTCLVDSDRVMFVAETIIGIYRISTNTWQTFTDTNVPGMDDAGSRYNIARYDLAADMIYFCAGASEHYFEGITAFSAYGEMKQTQYSIGALTTSWSWGTVDNLVQNYRDYEVSCCAYLTDQVIYAMWTRIVSTLYEGMWDKEGLALNLENFLVKDKEITYKRLIDGTPAELSFSVSSGHLFDVFNLNSMLNVYLAKERRLSLRFGELIGGIEYWQTFGNFTVASQKITYQRGEYPVMDITAYDKSKDWEQQDVVATDLYTGTTPENIILDLLTTYCPDIEAGDVLVGTWDTSIAINKQWIETDLRTIMQELSDRFGYYVRIDVNDDVTAKKISDSNTVDVIIPDLTKIINFTPDDDFSTVINRVVVVGTELTDTEVLYAEERVAGLNGSVAYNTGKEDHIVWYSEDQSRKCRYPRLVVIKTTQSIGFMLSGQIEEYITAGATEYYCIVTVDSPDLTMLLIISLGCLVASYFVFDFVEVEGVGASFGWTIRFGTYLTALFTWTTMQILGAVGNYDYDIFAQPVGYVKRTIQGEANDTTHQALIGKVVTKKIEDAYCYTQLQCQQVAEMELRIARMQRSRAKFEMLANLKIEEGDTIKFKHPYSQQYITLFVTDLERVMRAGSGNNGSFIDKIEGWVIT